MGVKGGPKHLATDVPAQDKSSSSIPFPPGFTPQVSLADSVGPTHGFSQSGSSKKVPLEEVAVSATYKSTPSAMLNSDNPKILTQSFSVVENLDSVIAVGQALGWDMTRCIKTLHDIINENGAHSGFQ